MKTTAKRRRTKAMVEEEKQESIRMNSEVQRKLARYEELEQANHEMSQ